MIFLTSNLGAVEIAKLLSGNIGFAPAEKFKNSKDQTKKIEEIARQAVLRRFSPEFINRLDHTIVFKPLNENHIGMIFDLELKKLQQRITESTNPFIVLCFEGVKQSIIRKGFSAEYGARHLKREFENMLTRPLANIAATHDFNFGDVVIVKYVPELDQFNFELWKAQSNKKSLRNY